MAIIYAKTGQKLTNFGDFWSVSPKKTEKIYKTSLKILTEAFF